MKSKGGPQQSLPPPLDHRSRTAEDVGRLFDYLVEHTEGVTYREAAEAWGWTRRHFLEVVLFFRRLFANDPSALVCNRDPDHLRGPWIYCISQDTREWHAARMAHVETEIETMRDVASSATKVLDGRTLMGKRAKLMHRSFVRLLEDLSELREQQAI